MAEITISGYTVLVDDEDVERIQAHHWIPGVKKNGVYFHYLLPRNRGTQKSVFLHRFLLNCDFGDGNIIDHINRNTLDNRKQNLRFATSAENRRNSNRRSDNTSGYKGVCYNKRDKTYIVEVVCGDVRCATSNRDAKLAAQIYDMLAIKLYKEYACTNFDRNNYTEQEIETLYSSIMDAKNRTKSSRFIGVTWHKQSNRWRATIKNNNQHIHIGNFKDEIEAAKEYDKMALLLHKSRARLNFPMEEE